mmetsp:Transcript_27126/g.67214  ORF Transcript_27126/g.67214 Transcript_27126/m.67214 type:complete len:437 (+) Transcript_27126:92-1402(+)
MRWLSDALSTLVTSAAAPVTMRNLDHVDSSTVAAAAASFLLDQTQQHAPPSPPASDEVVSRNALLVSLGVTAAVLAQLAGSIGLLLLKSSSLYEYQLPPTQRFRLFAGIFFQAVVPIATDSFAYAVCPLSLLAPLSGITIAATIVFTAARCCGVREPVHASDFAVVAMIVAGVTLVNVYGPHSSINVDVGKLSDYMLNVSWLIFAGTCGGLALLWLAIYVLVDLQCLNVLRPHPTSVFTTLGCAFSAACCSMLAQVFLKVLAISVKSVIDGNHFHSNEIAPIVAAACLLVVCATTNLYLLNCTMKSGKVIIAVPSYSSLTIVLTIVGASIFYGDFDSINPQEAINFGVGVAIVAIGIILLSILQWCRQMRKQRPRSKKPSEGDSLLSPPNARKTVSTSSEAGESASYFGDGASTYGDGASTYDDGASSFGDHSSKV